MSFDHKTKNEMPVLPENDSAELSPETQGMITEEAQRLAGVFSGFVEKEEVISSGIRALSTLAAKPLAVEDIEEKLTS